MGKRRTKSPPHAGFGGVLKALHAAYERERGAKLSHDALARIVNSKLKEKYAERLSIKGPTLWRWEEGEVLKMNPLILSVLGELYHVAPNAFIALLDANMRDVTMSAERAKALLEQMREQSGTEVAGGRAAHTPGGQCWLGGCGSCTHGGTAGSSP